jgi:hypothetical protein
MYHQRQKKKEEEEEEQLLRFYLMGLQELLFVV